jgi:LPS-assembly lipoprotein
MDRQRRNWIAFGARRFAGGMLFAGALPALGACGFSPVYGTGSGGASESVAAEMQATRIGIIDDREGQILHNLLLDRFNPRGRPPQPRHTLQVELTVSQTELGTQIDATTTRSRLSVTASAALRSGEERQEFVSTAVASFSNSESDYAAAVARDNALQRSLRSIADDLRVQIATYFEKQRLLRG